MSLFGTVKVGRSVTKAKAKIASVRVFGMVLTAIIVLNVSFFGTLQLLRHFDGAVIDTGADADDLGWPGATLRVIIPASVIAVSGSGIRVTFGAGSSRGLRISGAFVGEVASGGVPYNFANAPHRLTFAGSRSVLIEKRGAITSDEVKMPIQADRPLMISMFLDDKNNDDPVAKRPAPGWHTYFKFSDEAGLTNGASGYEDRSSKFVSHGIRTLSISARN